MIEFDGIENGDADVTTFQEDFDEMWARLAAHGAGERAIAGVIGSNGVDAIFGLEQKPPRIVQVIKTRHNNTATGLTATLVRVGVDSDDNPIVELGRHTHPLYLDPQVLFDDVTNPERTPPFAVKTEGQAVSSFDKLYLDVTTFAPLNEQ